MHCTLLRGCPQQDEGWQRRYQLPDGGISLSWGSGGSDTTYSVPGTLMITFVSRTHASFTSPSWGWAAQTWEWPTPGRFGLRLPSSTRCWPLNRQSETQAIKQIPAPLQRAQELHLPVRAQCKHNTDPPLASPAWEAF